MYEMHAGPDKSGGTLVWHVMAKQADLTLCGQKRFAGVEASDAQQAGHCTSCMALFTELMTSAQQ
ncbi:hypothetical protein ACIBAI_13485 [Streptomyces sp. NPDC051041]|uniref:hypothetical protein n=1 Tax=Streptomyces sp. NPDC051041 TaxID=3365640 RepID=UPI0037A225DD